MLKPIYRKFIFHLCIVGVLLSILAGFYDLIFGSLLEGGHLLFEVLEMVLDNIVEHLLGTGVHSTQMIVFYILLGLGGFLLYLIGKAITHWICDLVKNFSNEWLELRLTVAEDWGRFSTWQKALGIGLFIIGNYLLSFFFF